MRAILTEMVFITAPCFCVCLYSFLLVSSNAILTSHTFPSYVSNIPCPSYTSYFIHSWYLTVPFSLYLPYAFLDRAVEELCRAARGALRCVPIDVRIFAVAQRFVHPAGGQRRWQGPVLPQGRGGMRGGGDKGVNVLVKRYSNYNYRKVYTNW